MALSAYDEPLDVEICEGEVVVTAPRGAVAVSLTVEAAAETARRLEEAVRQAAQPPPL